MPRPAPSQPTEVELQILRILWEAGPVTVREIHNRISEYKETNYATTVKMLVVMLEKQLVSRDDSIRPQVYRAVVTQATTQRKMLNDLVRKVYDGSTKSLIMQALSSKKASQEDIDEIRNLLNEMDGTSK
jgi:BlaI family penicillinase repressor